jgi:rhamnose utilization protein RhaD (predicted bifunctional aldolase and dehydrogenase)
MLEDLVALTRALGQPQMDYVIIGEGNTSCRLSDDTFCVKASGRAMHEIDASGFVTMRLPEALAAIERGDNAGVQAAKADPASPQRPSIEAAFHALLLAECGARYIAHTHPTAVNAILCSSRARQFADGRLFPDEVVLCGPRSAFVPYADPGFGLALAIRDAARAYTQAEHEPPKVILLENHGMIALAQTPLEALNITAMTVKAARIFAGACAVGEPVFMSAADIAHIYKRPDEIYRRAGFVQKEG